MRNGCQSTTETNQDIEVFHHNPKAKNYALNIAREDVSTPGYIYSLTFQIFVCPGSQPQGQMIF